MANGRDIGRALFAGFAGAATQDPLFFQRAEQSAQQNQNTNRLRALQLEKLRGDIDAEAAARPVIQQQREVDLELKNENLGFLRDKKKRQDASQLMFRLKQFEGDPESQSKILKQHATFLMGDDRDPADTLDLLKLIGKDIGKFDETVNNSIEFFQTTGDLPATPVPKDTRTTLEKNVALASTPEGAAGIRALREAQEGPEKQVDDRTALVKGIEQVGQRLNIDTSTPEGFSKAAAEFKAINKSDPRSNLITVGSDGQITIAEGQQAIEAAERQKPTPTVLTDLQKNITSNNKNIRAMTGIKNAFDPEFVQFRGKIRAGLLKLKDKVTDLNDDEREFLKRHTRFEKRLNKFFVEFVKSMSGAAVSQGEMERLRDAVVNSADSPTVFQAAMDDFILEAQRSNRVMQRIIDEGFEGTKEELAAEFDDRFSIGVEVDIMDRFNELKEEGMEDPDLIEQRLLQEGYEF